RGVHEIGAVAVPLLAAQRDGGPDAGIDVSACGDDGEGGHFPDGADAAGVRRFVVVVAGADHGGAGNVRVRGVPSTGGNGPQSDSRPYDTVDAGHDHAGVRVEG